jgi:soluble lytic murein transglycosylase-like protein
MRRILAIAVLAAATVGAPPARADMYSYTDSDGVIHFTNITPRASDRKRWRVVMKTGPGKAAAIRGSCPRCDRVPATDRSRDRYSRYDAHILEAAELYQIPEALIRAVIKCESDYDPRVISSVGAMGLMQLMPFNIDEDRVSDPFEPRGNILGGTRQLRRWANKYDGDLILTLAAYSAGPGAVAKYGGLPPYETTQRYIRSVLKEYEKQKARLAAGR